MQGITEDKRRVISQKKQEEDMAVEKAQAKVLSLGERIRALESTNTAEGIAATEKKISNLLTEVEELKEALTIVDPTVLTKLAERKRIEKMQKEDELAGTCHEVQESKRSGGWTGVLNTYMAWIPSWGGQEAVHERAEPNGAPAVSGTPASQ
jgi:hypothetical protein